MEEIQGAFVDAMWKVVGAAILYLILPMVIMLLIARIFKMRGGAAKLLMLCGSAITLYIFVYFGIPEFTK